MYLLGRVDLAVRDTGRRLFENSQLRWLLLAYALYALTWQAATAFLPTYIIAGKGLSPAVANTSFGVLFVVGVMVKPLAGNLADRFSRERLAPALLALAAGALTAVIFAKGALAVTVTVACFAAGLLAYPPVMQAFFMDSFPTDSMAGDLGAMRSVYIGFGATGPLYVGVVADAVDYSPAFIGLVCCLLGSGLILVFGQHNGVDMGVVAIVCM